MLYLPAKWRSNNLHDVHLLPREAPLTGWTWRGSNTSAARPWTSTTTRATTSVSLYPLLLPFFPPSPTPPSDAEHLLDTFLTAPVSSFEEESCEDLILQLEEAADGLQDLRGNQQKEIDLLNDKSVALAQRFKDRVKAHVDAHNGIVKNFHLLERRMSSVCDIAQNIGERLDGIQRQLRRATFARDLLQYYQEFRLAVTTGGSAQTLTLLTELSLEEAAAYITELELITEGLSLKGSEPVCKLIRDTSEEILKRLLERFDQGNADRDYAVMRQSADAILGHFKHRQGNDHLFRRFVYYSLEPLAVARKLSTAYKLADMQQNLTLLFRQIRNVVRSRHEVVEKVFPNFADEIMVLLVERLFNDDVCGLQPVLKFFLFPEHREGKLPDHEHLNVLAAAHQQTSKLAEELTLGLKIRETTSFDIELTRALDAGKELPASMQFSKNKKRLMARQLSSGYEELKVSEVALETIKVRFDANFVRSQTHAVFEQFTGDYLEREIKLFRQRVLKALQGAFPGAFIAHHGEDFPSVKPPRQASSPTPGSEEIAAIRSRVKAFNSLEEDDPSLLLLKSDALRDCDLKEMVIVALGFQLSDGEEDASAEGYLPRQIIHWGREAHERCLELLAREKGRPQGSIVTLKGSEVNRECSDGLVQIFKKTCDFLFKYTLLPLVNLMILTLPMAPQVKDTDNPYTSEASADFVMDFIGTDIAEPYVVGTNKVYSDANLPRCLPLLAVNNSAVKSLLSKRKNALIGDTEALEAIEVFLGSLQVLEGCVEEMANHWSRCVFPAIQEFQNVSSDCQTYIERYLSLLEGRITQALEQIVSYANARMQAIMLVLQEKPDYRPSTRDNVEQPSFEQPTPAAAALADFLRDFLDTVANRNQSRVVRSLVAETSCLARDIFLASWRRVKISLQGSLKLLRDVEVVYTTISKYENTDRAASGWALMIEIAQLFVVKPESLADLINDDKSGLHQLGNRFIYDCITRRNDYTTSLLGGRADWVKRMFQDIKPR